MVMSGVIVNIMFIPNNPPRLNLDKIMGKNEKNCIA